MSSVIPIPWYQRINFRMLIVAAIVLVPVGAIGYLVLDQVLHHGQWQRNDARYGSYTLVNLKEMSSFEMDQLTATDNSIPADFRKLDGKRVMLVGEMYNGNTAGSKQRAFDLVFSIQKCCVGTTTKIQHFVKCSPEKGKTIDYYPNQVRVIGTLHVGIEKEDGAVGSVYRMVVERIDPVE